VKPVTNAENRFSGGDGSLGRDGACPSAIVAAAEAQEDKKSEARTRFCAAFTLIEILIVIGIILLLAGLILGVSGYVQEKGRRARAEAEIAAMSAALESYKADNGIYPQSTDTNSLDPSSTNPALYVPSSKSLYIQLSGDSDDNPTTSSSSDTKNYFGSGLKPNMLNPNPPGPNTYIHDPFGNSYGYSTARASSPSGTVGYNPTYDLWSTGGSITADTSKWIKNW
jgi:type II secretory pathway pseudopilin PulG